jgi:hypothetical protein
MNVYNSKGIANVLPMIHFDDLGMINYLQNKNQEEHFQTDYKDSFKIGPHKFFRMVEFTY